MDQGFPRGGRAPTTQGGSFTYCLGLFWPKTTWKWNKLNWEGVHALLVLYIHHYSSVHWISKAMNTPSVKRSVKVPLEYIVMLQNRSLPIFKRHHKLAIAAWRSVCSPLKLHLFIYSYLVCIYFLMVLKSVLIFNPYLISGGSRGVDHHPTTYGPTFFYDFMQFFGKCLLRRIFMFYHGWYFLTVKNQSSIP